jgi:competence protein ComEA
MSVADMSKFEFMQVSGIGEKKAEAIMQYRDENNVTEISELINVNGVGTKLLKRIELYIEEENKELSKSN